MSEPFDFDPDTTTARDASHFRRIIAARQAIAAADAELRAAVGAARAAGDSWTVIGMALDVSRQAAEQRFGTATNVTPLRRPNRKRAPAAATRTATKTTSERTAKRAAATRATKAAATKAPPMKAAARKTTPK